MKYAYIYLDKTRLELNPILQLLLDGKKLSAIKEIRQQIGIGLKEAKILVEHLEIEDYNGLVKNYGYTLVEPPKPTVVNIPQGREYIYVNEVRLQVAAIAKLLQEEGKIQAISAVKEEVGLGLKEAKELVEQIETNSYPIHFTKTNTVAGQKEVNTFNAVQGSTEGHKFLSVAFFLLLIGFLVYYLVL
ncbi:MAG: ribosomal protein L7/L12 [Aureispira sp.]